jgi:hypothetical protein
VVTAKVSNMSPHDEAKRVARTQRAVADLAGMDLTTLPDASLLDLARRLRTVARQLEALEIRVVGEIDARGATAETSSGSTTTWLRNELRVSDALLRVRSARALRRGGLFSDAFVAGELGLDHVGVVARLSARGCDITSPAVEHELVESARQSTPRRFARAAMTICRPVAGTPSASSNRSGDRWLRSRRFGDHAVALSARFDRAAGDELLAAIESMVESGEDDDQGSAPVRRANALLLLCRAAARNAEINGAPTASEADRAVAAYGRAADRAGVVQGKRRSSRPIGRSARRRVARRSHR